MEWLGGAFGDRCCTAGPTSLNFKVVVPVGTAPLENLPEVQARSEPRGPHLAQYDCAPL